MQLQCKILSEKNLKKKQQKPVNPTGDQAGDLVVVNVYYVTIVGIGHWLLEELWAYGYLLTGSMSGSVSLSQLSLELWRRFRLPESVVLPLELRVWSGVPITGIYSTLYIMHFHRFFIFILFFKRYIVLKSS